MASTITVNLSRNGKYAVLVDEAGEVYPCTDAEEAFEVLMELAGRQAAAPSQPYVEAEYVEDDAEYAEAEYVDAEGYPDEVAMEQYDDNWRAQNEQTISYDDGPLTEEERNQLDFGDPVTNAAADAAIRGGVSLFQALQSVSYRGKRQKARAAREAERAELEELRRIHRRRRR